MVNQGPDSNSAVRSGGVSFLGMLGLVFITLKLTGFIHWDWMWVTAPLWFPVLAVMLAFILIAVSVGLLSALDSWKSQRDFKKFVIKHSKQ